MIKGVVNDAYEAVVRLTVRGPSGQSQEIEAVIDTGYNGFLTLPPALVTELGLVYRDRSRATLADGSEAFFDMYDVAVLWDSRLRSTRASSADATPLIGMRLLDRYDLSIQVRIGGRVVIQSFTSV